jgi:hypothetical protein
MLFLLFDSLVCRKHRTIPGLAKDSRMVFETPAASAESPVGETAGERARKLIGFVLERGRQWDGWTHLDGPCFVQAGAHHVSQSRDACGKIR